VLDHLAEAGVNESSYFPQKETRDGDVEKTVETVTWFLTDRVHPAEAGCE